MCSGSDLVRFSEKWEHVGGCWQPRLREPAGGGERGYRLDSDSAAGGQLVAFQQQGSNVGPMGTLRAGNGSHTGGVPFTTDGTIVRRLTPVECERLQGFPDGWTTGQSDSQRYKQMGNAVTVPVFAWVARRIAALDAA